jgi:hypothetical protein
MHQLIRRLAALEALYQPRPAQSCIRVYQYRGETTADALRAEGHEREALGRLVIVFRRDHISRDTAQGESR